MRCTEYTRCTHLEVNWSKRFCSSDINVLSTWPFILLCTRKSQLCVVVMGTAAKRLGRSGPKSIGLVLRICLIRVFSFIMIHESAFALSNYQQTEWQTDKMTVTTNILVENTFSPSNKIWRFSFWFERVSMCLAYWCNWQCCEVDILHRVLEKLSYAAYTNIIFLFSNQTTRR